MTWVDVLAQANEELNDLGLESFSGEVLQADRGRMDKPFLVKDDTVLVRDINQDFGIPLIDLASYGMVADIISDRAGLPSPDTRTSKDFNEFVELFGSLDEGEASSYAPGDNSRKKENVCLLMRERGEEVRKIHDNTDNIFNQISSESSQILSQYLGDEIIDEYFDIVPTFYGNFIMDFTGAQTRRRHYEEHIEDIEKLIAYDGTTDKGKEKFGELKNRMPELREKDLDRLKEYEAAKQSLSNEFSDIVRRADSTKLAASIFYRDAAAPGVNPVHSPDEYLDQVSTIDYVDEEVAENIGEMVEEAIKFNSHSSNDLERAYKSSIRNHLS